MISPKTWIFLTLCLCVLADIPPNGTSNSTYNLFRVCPATCSKFFGSSSVLTDKNDMNKNLTVAVEKATNFVDVINSFVNYPFSYNLDILRTLEGLQLLSQYRQRFYEKYNTSKQQLISQFSIEEVCPPCSQTAGNSPFQDFIDRIAPYPGLLEDEVMDDDMQTEINGKSPILLAVSNYTLWSSSRLLPQNSSIANATHSVSFPNGDSICFIDFETRFQQMLCEQQLMDIFRARTISWTSLKAEVPSYPVNFMDVNWSGVSNQQIEGYAHFRLFQRFKNAITQAYFNCFAGNVLESCD